MLIRFKSGTEESRIHEFKNRIQGLGHESFYEADSSCLAVPTLKTKELMLQDKEVQMLESAEDPVEPYHLVSNRFRTRQNLDFGTHLFQKPDDFLIIAGPCSVETEEQMELIASAVKQSGQRFLRGGAYKPRTSPYSFQGLEDLGLKLIREAADRHGLLVVSEIMDPRDLDQFLSFVDVIQIGTRNMMNYRLLKEVGKSKKPVLLKRGMSATLEEWLLSAEYIASEGNSNIILCERGIRSFDASTRNVLDLACIPRLKQMTWLPVIIDPSHGTGYSSLVPSMAMASLAAGARGLLIEVHPDPKKALSDGQQALTIPQYLELVPRLKAIQSVLYNT
ncbi:MAG: 3-deoxy-7-phosphoheptulonate synthase [Candidatus Cloacimonetes bacterium]|nr:3-deoxy-7-phosphoheptulonate synthase [Candidatus Cloacimonadota bacterium]